MRARRWLAGALVCACVASAPLLMVACLADLDTALECPPSTKHPSEACEPALADVGDPGCFTYREDAPKYYECLAGHRETCDCTPGECPADDAACYPPGDCPPEVREVAGPDAKCIRLQPDDFGYGGVPQFSQCLCGCFACASVCDGVGPVFGVRDPGIVDGNLTYNPPIIDIERYMPVTGTLGYYVRARGISNANLITIYGDVHAEEPTFSGYVMTTPLDDFGEQVFYKGGFVGTGDPYSWTDESQKPKILELVLGGGTVDDPQLALYEIDCIIPFVVPN